MTFSYQPGAPAPRYQRAAPSPWPVKGDWVEIDGIEYVVALFEESMNMVEIVTDHLGGVPRFFTIADWKRMWERRA